MVLWRTTENTLAFNLLNSSQSRRVIESERDVIVKVELNIGFGVKNVENSALASSEAPAHLTFRRIIVHDFADGDDDPTPQPLRFYYRGHSKHLGPRRAA